MKRQTKSIEVQPLKKKFSHIISSPQLKRSASQNSSERFLKQSSRQSPTLMGTDDMVDSVIVSEFSKLQMQMNKSVTSSMSGASPKRSQQTLNNSIITKKLSSNRMNNSHDKTVIKMLGLNLEAVCNKSGHEKNKIVFICENLDCVAPNRLGCAHCFLSEHNDHSTDRCNIQDFCQKFDDQILKFRQIIQDLQQIDPHQRQLIVTIQNQFQQFRTEISKQLAQLEQTIIQQAEDVLTQHDSWISMSQQVELLNRKNLFTMDSEEQQQAIELVYSKQIDALLDLKENVFEHHNDQDNMMKEAWQKFDRQIQIDMFAALQDNSELIFPPLDKKCEAQRRNQQLDGKKNTIEIEYHKNQKIIKDLDQKTNDQIDISIQKTNESLALIKKQQEDYKRQQKLIKDRELDIERQKKSAEKLADQKKKEQDSIRQEEERMKQIRKTFPYQIYEQSCGHIIPCNTIPVFACCNRAYQCNTCHGNVYHPPTVTYPSVRYCVSCLQIYQVNFPTNLSVNCLKCLKS